MRNRRSGCCLSVSVDLYLADKLSRHVRWLSREGDAILPPLSLLLAFFYVTSFHELAHLGLHVPHATQAHLALRLLSLLFRDVSIEEIVAAGKRVSL